MDWMVFWTAFGAIGGSIGALATAAAVIVALWQTKYAYKKKLKLTFCDDVKIASNAGMLITELISLTITNIGNKTILLDSWGFKLKGSKRMKIFTNLPSETIPCQIRSQFTIKTPYELIPEHTVTFYYEKEKFCQVVTQSCENKELDEKQKIKFYVTDSTNTDYFAISTKSAKSYLQQSDRNIK